MSAISEHVMKAAAEAHAEFAKSSVGDNLTTIIARAIAKAVEGERLRFEGDLDKWMKIIGAGITGFQPEAYAVMDSACAELLNLRLEKEALAELPPAETIPEGWERRPERYDNYPWTVELEADGWHLRNLQRLGMYREVSLHPTAIEAMKAVPVRSESSR